MGGDRGHPDQTAFQDDPYLDGVGAVVLDEFHERSQHADLALAWLAELRRSVRPDLAVVVMSATWLRNRWRHFAMMRRSFE